MLAVLLVVVLVVVLLSCCCHCLHLLWCCIANTAAAATVCTPPLPPPLPLLSVGEQDDACYTNADSSPATLAQGGTNGGGQSDRYGPPLPHPRRHDGDEGSEQVKAEATKRAITMVTRVASDDDGAGDGGKSDGNGDEVAGRVTTRTMVVATTVAAMRVASNEEDEGAGQATMRAMAAAMTVALFFVGHVLFWRKRYVQNYVSAFCACGWGLVLSTKLLAGKVCFYVFMFLCFLKTSLWTRPKTAEKSSSSPCAAGVYLFCITVTRVACSQAFLLCPLSSYLRISPLVVTLRTYIPIHIGFGLRVPT